MRRIAPLLLIALLIGLAVFTVPITGGKPQQVARIARGMIGSVNADETLLLGVFAVVALVLAAVNQVFSLLDPLIFRYVIDEYATRYQEYTTEQFFRGVSLLLAAGLWAS